MKNNIDNSLIQKVIEDGYSFFYDKTCRKFEEVDSLMKQVIYDHTNSAIIKEKLINNKISIMHSNADYFDDK